MSDVNIADSKNIKLFKKVLIANRGEIAVRIIRALRHLGIPSVAIYSQADSKCEHRAMADEAIFLEGKTLPETYLCIEKIVDLAKTVGAQAVHPGVGFLSENKDFAKAVMDTGISYIGPTLESYNLMGSKIAARKLMKAHGIPILPGNDDALKNADELRDCAERIGYPVIVKASHGGGGRGMQVIWNKDQVKDVFATCQRQAQAYFGQPEVFCEKYLQKPHHIEIQVLFDKYGAGMHFHERDCSIQRRHQKLFEEAPSPFLNDKQRERLGEIALKVGRAAKYLGVGTVEMIMEHPDEPYFMEMNTRLQVEHPVTELICGIDLVKEQILTACGKPISGDSFPIRGWAMEARINAEDSDQDFRPASGRIRKLALPGGPFVRFDSHIYQGYDVPNDFDSLLGKLIVWGKDRNEALRRMHCALGELKVSGVINTASFHLALLEHPEFATGNFATDFIPQNQEYFKKKSSADGLEGDLLAAIGLQRELGQRSLGAI